MIDNGGVLRKYAVITKTTHTRETNYSIRKGDSIFKVALSISELRVQGNIYFLADTGSDYTVIHAPDGEHMGIPFSRLDNKLSIAGIGGTQEYFSEDAVLAFSDGTLLRAYLLQVAIAKPSTSAGSFPSMIGRPLLHKWRMVP